MVSDITYIKDYIVLKIWNSGEGIKTYVAGKQGQSGQTFLINEIADRKIIDRYMPQIVMLKKEAVPEFQEYFTLDSKVYAVFRYEPGTSIQSLLGETRLDFTYRVELFEKILQKLAAYGSFPALMKATALFGENIVLEANQLSFNFRFYADRGTLEQEETVYRNLGELLAVFFTQKERENYTGLRLMEEKCKKGIYTSLGQVLQDVSRIFTSMDKTQEMKLKLKEKKQNVKKTMLTIGFALLMIAAVIYFYTHYISSDVEEALYSDVERIGTVNVDGVDWEDGTYVYIDNYEDMRLWNAYTEDLNALIQDESEEEDGSEEDESEREREEERDFPEGMNYKPSNKDTIYTVKGEDNLSQIVFEEYGTTEYVEEIRKLNGIGEDGIIQPGQKIILPEKP